MVMGRRVFQLSRNRHILDVSGADKDNLKSSQGDDCGGTFKGQVVLLVLIDIIFFFCLALITVHIESIFNFLSIARYTFALRV